MYQRHVRIVLPTSRFIDTLGAMTIFHLLEQQMTDLSQTQSDTTDRQSPWDPKVRRLLQDWRDRAEATSKTHYAMANRYAGRHLRLGVPVVGLTTLVGTSVFATLQESLNTSMRIFAGVAIVVAAVLASLQTFLNYSEKAEKNRVAAERWSAVRREISQMLALRPMNVATRDESKNYLDELRARMDEASAEAPEMPDSLWARTLAQTKAKNSSEHLI